MSAYFPYVWHVEEIENVSPETLVLFYTDDESIEYPISNN